jgi:hypothetical protein
LRLNDGRAFDRRPMFENSRECLRKKALGKSS